MDAAKLNSSWRPSVRVSLVFLCWFAALTALGAWEYLSFSAQISVSLQPSAYLAATLLFHGLIVISALTLAILSFSLSWKISISLWIVSISITCVPPHSLFATWPFADATAGRLLIFILFTIALLVALSLRRYQLRASSSQREVHRYALAQENLANLTRARERNRIAREMHDVVAHSLAVMVTMADGASAVVETNPEEAKKALALLGDTGRQALKDTRWLVGVLRDEQLSDDDELPSLANHHEGTSAKLTAADRSPAPQMNELEDLINRFKSAGMPMSFTWHGSPLPPDPNLHMTVYRIIQEALTNILRYAARSPRVAITVERYTGMVEIRVANDSPESTDLLVKGSGKGLSGMRERAAVYGGSVTAGPTARGWQVTAILKWHEYQEGNVAWTMPT